jgi:UPF0755 protein
MMRRAVIGGSIAVAVLLAVLAGGYGWVRAAFDAAGPSGADATLVLPRGSGLNSIADALKKSGLIDRRWVFIGGVRLAGEAHELKAGEYFFPAHISPRQIMDLLRQGRTVVRHLTVPEGLTSAEVLALVTSARALEGDVPHNVAEGALLPETYNYSWGETRTAMVQRMRHAMDETLEGLWSSRSPGLPFATPQQALILASIVEKETGLAAERPRIAAVFINRLRLGMKLQSDPTVLYALSHGQGPLGRELGHADLDLPSPYNTYRNDGLPPGPIANPGRAAIAATMLPLFTKELYFVADGTGGHAFAETLEQHNRNVHRWRQQQ